MISVDESSEWSPHGREVVARHPLHCEEKEGEQEEVTNNNNDDVLYQQL